VPAPVHHPETTPGGRALKFYASVRLDIRRIGAVKDGSDVVGNRTRVKVVKNKVAPPFKQAEFDIIYNHGISQEGEIIDLASDLSILEKSGTWYSFDGERLGQGRENVRLFLTEHTDIKEAVRTRIKEQMGLLHMKASDEEAPGEDD